MKPEQVYIHNAFVGGGFGRKSSNDEMIQAIQVAKVVGKPVKLVWTREEDMRHDRYRPQAAVRLKAGLGADGSPVGWTMRTAVGSLLRSLGVNKVKNGIPPSGAASRARHIRRRSEDRPDHALAHKSPRYGEAHPRRSRQQLLCAFAAR
jgi:isoquinoline 1-oxidoreductase beta subunit